MFWGFSPNQIKTSHLNTFCATSDLCILIQVATSFDLKYITGGYRPVRPKVTCLTNSRRPEQNITGRKITFIVNLKLRGNFWMISLIFLIDS